MSVSQPLVSKLPDFSAKFNIECDAFDVGLGANLIQGGEQLAFFSKALNGRALLLSTYEKKLLALVTTVAKSKILNKNIPTSS